MHASRVDPVARSLAAPGSRCRAVRGLLAGLISWGPAAKSVFLGLAIVASLAMSLIGPSGLGGIPSVAACGGAWWEEECDYDSRDYEEPYVDPRQEQADEQAEDEAQEQALERALCAGAQQPCSLDILRCGESPDICSFDASGNILDGPAYGCDWNYATHPTGCVPEGFGDYDCDQLLLTGLSNIRVIGEDWMLLDDDGDGVGCEPEVAGQVAGAAIPSNDSLPDAARGAPSFEGCSAALTSLLPTQGEMGLDWPMDSGAVTGGGCRTLPEVAATLENPQQAAADMAAMGWIENVFQTFNYGGEIRISIHRFASPEGAVQALNYFGTVVGEPAGTVALDASPPSPNQLWLVQPRNGWASLWEQDGEFLTRVTVRVYGLVPPQSDVESVMAAVHARWASSSAQPTTTMSRTLDCSTGVCIYTDDQTGVQTLAPGPAPAPVRPTQGGHVDAIIDASGSHGPLETSSRKPTRGRNTPAPPSFLVTPWRPRIRVTRTTAIPRQAAAFRTFATTTAANCVLWGLATFR